MNKVLISKQQIVGEIANLLLLKNREYTKTLCKSCFQQVNIDALIYNMDVCLCNAKRVLEGKYIPKSVRFEMARKVLADMVDYLYDGVYGSYFGEELDEDFLSDYHMFLNSVYLVLGVRDGDGFQETGSFEVFCEYLQLGCEVINLHLVNHLYELKDVYFWTFYDA